MIVGRDSHDSNGIVVEDGRDVFGWELVGCVGDEEARFAHGTVTDDNASVGLWSALVCEVQELRIRSWFSIVKSDERMTVVTCYRIIAIEARSPIQMVAGQGNAGRQKGLYACCSPVQQQQRGRVRACRAVTYLIVATVILVAGGALRQGGRGK